jgi:hypothetical protein
MARLIELLVERYAVLKGLENNGIRARFVIAYRDEQTLRERLRAERKPVAQAIAASHSTLHAFVASSRE